jgi:drug/metabolite transporter (DMT)-like permease
MTDTRRGTTGGVSLQDLGFLIFLGAVWGGAFLFLRIAAPQVGPLWAAEIRIGLAAVILLAIAGPRAYRALRGRFLKVAVVGAAFSAIPFSLIAFAALTLPAGFGALLNAATPIFTALVAAAWLGSGQSSHRIRATMPDPRHRRPATTDLPQLRTRSPPRRSRSVRLR